MLITKREKREKKMKDFIPCVVYSKGFNVLGKLNKVEAKKLIYKGVYADVKNIYLEKENMNVLVKEIQFHPLTREILHVDFFQIKDDSYVNLCIDIVPINIGESEAVKHGCTIVAQKKIKVKCLAKNIKKEIQLDVSSLKAGYSIFSDMINIPGLKFNKRIALVSAIEGAK